MDFLTRRRQEASGSVASLNLIYLLQIPSLPLNTNRKHHL